MLPLGKDFSGICLIFPPQEDLKFLSGQLLVEKLEEFLRFPREMLLDSRWIKYPRDPSGAALRQKGFEKSQTGIFISQKGSGLGILTLCCGWRMRHVLVRVFIQPWDDGEEGLEVLLDLGQRGRNAGKNGIQPWRDPGVELHLDLQCLGEYLSQNLQLLSQLSSLF